MVRGDTDRAKGVPFEGAALFVFAGTAIMKQDEEQWVTLVRKFAVCDTEEWNPSRLYWSVEIQGWVNLHNERTPPTFFDKMGDAKFLSMRMDKGFVTAVHVDP